MRVRMNALLSRVARGLAGVVDDVLLVLLDLVVADAALLVLLDDVVHDAAGFAAHEVAGQLELGRAGELGDDLLALGVLR